VLGTVIIYARLWNPDTKLRTSGGAVVAVGSCKFRVDSFTTLGCFQMNTKPSSIYTETNDVVSVEN